MGYEYDIFISYRRREPPQNWLSNYFYKKLSEELGYALPEARIFFDRENVISGEVWNRKVKQALISSRFIIPVLTPQYFDPVENVAILELAYMLHRYDKYGNNKMSPIIPVLQMYQDLIVNCRFAYVDLLNTRRLLTGRNADLTRALEKGVETIVKDILQKYDSIPEWSQNFEDDGLFTDVEKYIQDIKSMYKLCDQFDNFDLANFFKL